MGDKEDYLTPYRVFFENFAANVNPEDQLPVNIAGYTITESELTGEVIYWITQYLTEKQCPLTLMTPLRRIILDEVRVASKKYPNDFGYKSEEAVYIALRLMQAVTAKVNDVCLRYLDNARLDTLPPPPPLAQRDLKTVSCATKNSRRVMEDRHVEIGNLEALFGVETTEPTSFYAVYDGHAGSAAATYCAAHLHQYLIESPHFSTDLTKAMRDAFLKTDAEFIRKSNQERACGGSTAVAVTVRGRRLLAAWAGDSLALLAKRMRLMQLVRPHKPSREDERERIEKQGGTVMYWGTWRVNGQLAVSRAIGDAQYKPYVTAKPEYATVDLDGDEDFVVVACDGLWDFVSEDDVALSVYRQIAADPDDLKAVTKRLIVQAKRQGSADNISIIVVFLKDPRDIATDNRPPMDLGLDNALANVPPFASEEACKQPADATAAAAADADADADAVADNGVDNSDSDSEDLGPETAVDADDIDADARNHEPAAPTPPVHTVEEGQVDGVLVDNVAESGDESEDEWNYFKGEGEREDNPSEEPDELPRSDTPCQDNSAWETSSVDMNSSPLNPDAPVFIPGSVGGSDVLLAESPRKPMPMDDIELPDVAQFETEAVVRPAELLDLDNCDQLNGHHNASIDIKEHLNGNDKCMDSLGFGFNVGIEPDKVKDSLIQDFERIQKDTTDFCNLQVFQAHTETNPFAEPFEGNDELLERLKNKERDPMSMSFYQEKDDDTCDRPPRELHVDLNAVQPLPDSDDEDLQTNGISENDKENISPDQHTDLFGSLHSQEPNNDILRFDDRTEFLLNNIASFGQTDNCNYSVPSNVQPFSNIDFEANIPQESVLQTDTPESHKLLFEQIPEIPDGKSSELGFTNDELDPESERDDRATPKDEKSQVSHGFDSKRDSPDIKPENELETEPENENFDDQNDQRSEHQLTLEEEELLLQTPPSAQGTQQADIIVHENAEIDQTIEEKIAAAVPHIQLQNERLSPDAVEAESTESQTQLASSPSPSPQFKEPSIPRESPLPAMSPIPTEPLSNDRSREPSLPRESPFCVENIASPIPDASLPAEALLPAEVLSRDSPLPAEVLSRDSPLPAEVLSRDSPLLPQEIPLPAESPLPTQSPLPARSPLLMEPEAELTRVSPFPSKSPLSTEISLPSESPLPTESPAPEETIESQRLEETQPITSFETAAIETEAVQVRRFETLETMSFETELQSEPDVKASHDIHVEESAPVASPLPIEPEVQKEDALIDASVMETIEVTAAVSREGTPGPAPDLLTRAATELVTDIDVGVPESRAQEICVPVTEEIRPEDGERPADTTTPPSTPAVEPLAAAAIAAAGVAALAAKKTPTAKKPATPLAKTTPKSATKPPAPRTSTSATKRPLPRTPLSAPRAAPTKTPPSATKPAAPKPPVKAPPPIRAPTKPLVAKTTAPVAAKPTAPVAAKPAPKPPVPRAPAPRPATAPASRTATSRVSATKPPITKTTSATATKTASTLVKPRPTTAPARPAPRPSAPAPARKAPEKPLTNGDVKEAKSAPATRPPPITRPAPRPTPRAAAPIPPPPAKAAAPKPATRAPLDKQSKDLANKRITAKAAPPRTAATKAPNTKAPVTRPAKKADPVKKEPAQNGLTNGTELAKPPPSPPAQDNAALPDVIA